jgi:hypothetical protein
MATIYDQLKKEPNINPVFRQLKPVQVLTPEGIFLLERVKIHLESYNNVLPNESSKGVIAELTELIEEIKNN